MRADSPRWRVVAPSPWPHEREGQEAVRALLPDAAPYQVWTNLEFVADDGSVNEVDLLVLAPSGLYVVEMKYMHGRVAGTGQRWSYGDGHVKHIDNPLIGANLKAKRLGGLLKSAAARRNARGVVPFVKAAVFLHNPDIKVALDDVGRQHVYGLDGAAGRGNGLPQLVHDLLTRPATSDRDLVDASREKALVALMGDLGIRPGDQRRRVGSNLVDPEPLAEGRGWQDYLGHPEAMPDVTRRVRIYRASKGASADERATITRAAEREFRLLQGIEHIGVARPTDIAAVDNGIALVFPWVDGQVRFDLWLAGRADDLSLAQRLALVRQLAETVKYAHARRLVHRALSPPAVWVLDPAAADPRLAVSDWQAAGQQSLTRSTAATRTLHMDRVIDVATESYLAPELAFDPGSASPQLDVFGLGALAYTILTGRPPAETGVELAARLREDDGLDVTAVDPDAPAVLRTLVWEATLGDPTARTASVEQFLAGLDAAEQALLQRDAVVAVDPLDAGVDDVLDGRWRVVRRLGRGSTAVALLVRDVANPDADPVVLKVALDHDKARRLDAEAEVLDHLDDGTKVAQLLDRQTVGGRDTLVLEYAGDESLAQELDASGALHLDRLERYGRDLLEIAAYLDTKGVWHRDLKPDNLGVRQRPGDRTKHLVLFDFSLAAAPADQITAGTPPYLDPFLGTSARPRYDAAAERFALAVTLYQMATGTTPRWGDGGAHPAQVDHEVSLDADLIDPGVRDRLTAFFATALARDARDRYATVDDMARAWVAAFTDLDRTKADEPQPEAGDLTAASPLADAGLSRRALAALERNDLLTVADLVAADPFELSRLPGVNLATKREIATVAKQLRVRFAPAPDRAADSGERVGGDADEQPDASAAESTLARAATSVDAVVRSLLNAATPGGRGREQARRILALDLGRPDPERPADAPLHWPSRSQVADRVGLTQARVSQIVRTAVTGPWSQHAALTQLRDDVVDLLDLNGGVMTADELAAAVLAERGSVATGDRRTCQALGLVRAAVETELERGGDSRIDLRRKTRPGDRDLVLLARESDDPADLPAAVRLDYALALGDRAADLAGKDPLPTPAAVAAALADVTRPDGVDPLPDPRLATLAAAVAGVAVTADRQLYPVGLPAAGALRLVGLPPGAGRGIDPDVLRERVARRYPAAERLPDRPRLDDVIRAAGLQLVWDTAAGAYRSPALTGDTTYGSLTRLTGTHADTADETVGDDVRDLDRRIADAVDHGRLLVAVAPAGLLDTARDRLTTRHRLTPIDVTAHLLDRTRAEADRRGVRWDTVLAADAAADGSRDRENLRRLLDPVLTGLPEQIAATGGPVLLTDAEPLARYDRLADLATWIADARPPAPGVLLVPADGHGGTPQLDGHALPVLSDAQWVVLTRDWLGWTGPAAPEGARP